MSQAVDGTAALHRDRPSPASRLQVYVHLAHGFDAAVWQRRWVSKDLLGLNEQSPYGYHHAAAYGCDLTFSHDRPERWYNRMLRGGFRVLLGFDLVHAFRNRHRIRQADVVWTHTESQHLAIFALQRLLRLKRPAPLIAQSVWLIDSWTKMPAWQKVMVRLLLRKADLLTFHSPLNAEAARRLFPQVRCEVVPFGILAERQATPHAQAHDGPLRVLAVGNDRHRDWPTLVAALGSQPAFTVRIASKTIDRALVVGHANIEADAVRSNDEMKALYRWCDVVVLPLAHNLHASGITVLQEAALFGKPAVCSRVGGLDAYFAPEEVSYVPPGDPARLRAAVEALGADPSAAERMAARAQARMSPAGLSSQSFVRRHVELSRELLGLPAQAGV